MSIQVIFHADHIKEDPKAHLRNLLVDYLAFRGVGDGILHFTSRKSWKCKGTPNTQGLKLLGTMPNGVEVRIHAGSNDNSMKAILRMQNMNNKVLCKILSMDPVVESPAVHPGQSPEQEEAGLGETLPKDTRNKEETTMSPDPKPIRDFFENEEKVKEVLAGIEKHQPANGEEIAELVRSAYNRPDLNRKQTGSFISKARNEGLVEKVGSQGYRLTNLGKSHIHPQGNGHKSKRVQENDTEQVVTKVADDVKSHLDAIRTHIVEKQEKASRNVQDQTDQVCVAKGMLEEALVQFNHADLALMNSKAQQVLDHINEIRKLSGDAEALQEIESANKAEVDRLEDQVKEAKKQIYAAEGILEEARTQLENAKMVSIQKWVAALETLEDLEKALAE